MEDVVSKGYSITKKEEFMSLEEIHLCLKSLAQFNAVSFCMESEGGKLTELREKFPKTWEDCLGSEQNHEGLRPYFENEMRAVLKLLIAVLDQKEKGNPLLNDLVIPTNISKDLLSKIAEYPMMKVFTATRAQNLGEAGVLAHGDYHMWNVAIKDDLIKMFDFQIIHYSSFGGDLNRFLSQASTPTQRKQHLTNFLQSYVDAFKDACAKMGFSDVGDKMTFDFCRKEYVDQSAQGLLIGSVFVMPRFIEDTEIYGQAKNSSASSDIVELLEKSSKSIWMAIQLYFEFIDDYLSLGTFSRIENILKQ